MEDLKPSIDKSSSSYVHNKNNFLEKLKELRGQVSPEILETLKKAIIKEEFKRFNLPDSVLFSAIKTDDIPTIKNFIENNCTWHNERIIIHGNTLNPLLYAIHEGKNRDLIELLLKSGADANGKDSFKNTALHFAFMYKQLESIELIAEYSNSFNEYNLFGLTPLLLCFHSIYNRYASLRIISNTKNLEKNYLKKEIEQLKKIKLIFDNHHAQLPNNQSYNFLKWYEQIENNL